MSQLTPRQIDLMRWIAEGCDTNDAARRMHICPSSVYYLLRRIHKTLGTYNRSQILAVCLEADWWGTPRPREYWLRDGDTKRYRNRTSVAAAQGEGAAATGHTPGGVA